MNCFINTFQSVEIILAVFLTKVDFNQVNKINFMLSLLFLVLFCQMYTCKYKYMNLYAFIYFRALTIT